MRSKVEEKSIKTIGISRIVLAFFVKFPAHLHALTIRHGRKSDRWNDTLHYADYSRQSNG